MLTDKTIINLAPTGLVASKLDNPRIPTTADEIVKDVSACYLEGVSIVHVHARSIDDSASSDPEVYSEIIQRLRAQCQDIVITASTSGRVHGDFDKRSAVLNLEGEAKPDMASLTLGSLNFSQSASVNNPDVIQRLAAVMRERDIKPELEVFDLGMVNYAKYLIKKGLITPPYYFNIILGGPASAQANLSHLALMVNDLPPESVWCVAGIGAAQLQMNTVGITMGDGARVGLEDNLWMDDKRKKMASNLELVKRATAIARLIGKTPITSKELRQYLGLHPNPVVMRQGETA